MPPVLSKIDNVTKDIVNGWIRKQQQQLNTIIPTALNGICINYYFEDEMFNVNENQIMLKKMGINMQLSSNKKYISLTCTKKHRWQVIYGCNEILLNNVYCRYNYIWTMKIHKANDTVDDPSIIIGFTEVPFVESDFTYKYSNNGCLYRIAYPQTVTKYGQGFGTNDEVSVSLNTKTMQVRFQVNGCDQGHLLKLYQGNQERKVRLELAIAGPNIEIELVRFHRDKC